MLSCQQSVMGCGDVFRKIFLCGTLFRQGNRCQLEVRVPLVAISLILFCVTAAVVAPTWIHRYSSINTYIRTIILQPSPKEFPWGSSPEGMLDHSAFNTHQSTSFRRILLLYFVYSFCIEKGKERCIYRLRRPHKSLPARKPASGSKRTISKSSAAKIEARGGEARDRTARKGNGGQEQMLAGRSSIATSLQR